MKVGILGVAGISRKTAISINNEDSHCQVRGVASRSPEKAKTFIEEFFPENDTVMAFGGSTGYDDMLQSDLIEAVYIPLPTVLKKDWAIKALQAKKHVVLEKPVALSAKDYQEVLQVAYANNKFLLDGTMFPHHKRTEDILQKYVTNDGSLLGSIRRLDANFTFMTDEGWEDSDIRAKKDGDPQGCIGDLGWYCIRFGLMVFDKLDSKVTSAQVVDYTMNKNGVPVDATCVVKFENNQKLFFHCGFKTGFRQRFEIAGSKQFLLVEDLVLPKAAPTTYSVISSTLGDNAVLTYHDKQIVEAPAGPVHEVQLWQTFSKICKSLDNKSTTANLNKEEGNEDARKDYDGWMGETDELTNEANQWGLISLLNQKVVDCLMESLYNNGTVVEMK